MKTLQELQEIRERMRSAVADRKESGAGTTEKMSVLVCGGTGCTSGNSKIIFENLKTKVAAAGIENKVDIILTGCFGLCSKGPIVVVYPDGAFYTHVKPEDVDDIVNDHLVGGTPVERLLHAEKDADGLMK